MRAFIAIDLDPEIKESLQTLVRGLRALRADIRWVDTGAMHLTLKFLGPLDDEGAARVGNVLTEIARRHRPFPLRLVGTGAFPDERRPRVLWVGFVLEPALSDLQSDIDRTLADEGFEPEKRAFVPHLTLGRVKGPGGIARATAELGRHRESSFGDMTVRTVALYESLLRPEGAEYRIAREASLP